MIKFLPMARKGRFLLMLLLGMASVELSSAQCTNTSQFGSGSAPTVAGATNTISTCNYLAEFSPITGFSTANIYSLGINVSGYITVYAQTGGPAVAFGPAPLSFTPPANGTYVAHWNVNAACGQAFNCVVTTVTNVGPSSACTNPVAAGTTTANPTLACVGQPVNVALSGATTGSSLTYQWQSSTDGITYVDIVGATNSSYSGTQSVTTYYQCIVVCSAGTPAISTPVQVDMNSFFNCYCNSSANSQNDTEINSVAVGTLNNFSGCGTTGGGASAVGQYSDFTNLTPPNLVQGLSNNFVLEIGTCGAGSYNNMSKVYIDFNQNGDFADPGEEVYVSAGPISGAHTETFVLTVPMSSLSGNTGMRVVTVETSNPGVIVPCGGYGWGETEDYVVNIVPPLNDDAGIAEFVTPSLPTCNFSDSVRVSLTNFGLDTLVSAQINWEWNSVPQLPISWTGSIAPFASETVTLGFVALAAGDDLTAYTTLPNGLVEDPAGAYNDTVMITNLQPGLSGLYTIGGTAPDYADIDAAIADLSALDVCGPVVFDIRDGVYTGQINLPSLLNSSPTNTVTFRSENGDAALVTLDYATAGTGDNYVVNMQGANNYNFENLTIQNTGTGTSARVIVMSGSSMNTFVGCHLLGSTTATTTSFNTAVVFSGGGTDSNNLFLNNTIEGGSYGAYWYGSGATSPEKNNVFDGNNFLSNYWYGARFQNNESIVVKNNTCDGISAYNFTRYGLYFSNVSGSTEITGNVVKGEGTSGWYYGIYWTNGGGTNANHALVANNMLSVGKPGNTSSIYGIYYSNVGYVNTYHNTASVIAGGNFSRAFYATGGFGNLVMNNIFANETGGFAMYVNSTFSVSNSDYNVLYSPNGNTGYFGSNQASLSDWQNASAFDANSIDYNPNFYSNTDLHVCNDSIGNQGTPIASVTMDIDSHPRDAATPDMGADEFSGLSGSFLGNDVAVCAGDSVQLWAGSPSDDILWSTGDTTSSIWVSAPGSFTVSVTGPCGAGTDAIVVTASALNYTGYLLASDLEFCNGSSVTLSSSQSANTYSWTGGSSDDSLVVTTGGIYTLDIADGCGTGSESVTITMNDVPTTSFTHATNYITGIFTNTTTGAGSNATYAWDFGDGTTSTLVDPVHIFPGTGLYYVTLTVTNDCGTLMFGDTVNLFSLGVAEIADLGSVNVYPNPSTGLYSVDLELLEAMNVELRITNVMGQIVSTKSIQSANGSFSEQFDLTNEAAGVYYLDILSDNTKLAKRILIKR